MAIAVAVALLVTACGGGSDEKQQPVATPNPQGGAAAERTPMSSKQYSQPDQVLDEGATYTATIDTNYGKIVVDLFADEAPLAVNSFVFLARDGYFNNVKFHRVVQGFVIQSGDPTGTGAGGPGYRFNDEPVTRNYERGTLAMANSGANTNGSQFFITLADLTGRLPKNYTIFGKVTEGMDVVDKIAVVPVAVGRSGERSSPTADVHITTVTIDEKKP